MVLSAVQWTGAVHDSYQVEVIFASGLAKHFPVECSVFIIFDLIHLKILLMKLFSFLLFVKLHVCMNAALNKVGVEYCKYAKCYQEHEFFVPCVTLPTNKKSVRIRDPTYFIMTNSDQSAGHMRTFF